ncbi:MAG: ATP-grasp domain-containing protein, partial [Polaromonas sp.]|nr:ATP-grasp domain-containing protein [Polaromonas sp.]
MEVSRIRALRGPNLWSRHTALEAIVACTTVECNIAGLPGFEPRVRSLFPEMGAFRQTGHAGPVSLAHVLEAAALALQTAAGCPLTFSHTASTVEAGTYQVVVEYSEETVGRLAFELAQALIHAALRDNAFVVEAAIAQLRDLDEDERLGPSTGAIVDAAVARGIPYRRLTKGSMVQFGWGSKQRRIQAAELDATSAVAESIAQDKDLTKMLLRAAGVPVPLGRPVADPDDAWVAAQEVGLPAVVKPLDGNQGKGVTVNITTRDHLDVAYKAAAEYGQVMVEKFLPGSDFRLLVVGNKLVAASRREPPQVVGDGLHTVRELVDIVNQDPRRGEGHATSLTKIRFDEIAVARLEAQDLTPDSIPAKGRRVILRNNANLSTGGTATDVTDDVHPAVAARAVAAAQMVGLHICGVDVVCESMLRPLESQSGGVVEVNAAPGLRMHLSPSYGKGRAVGVAMIDELFPAGDNGRVPVIAVTGTNGKTTTTRLIAHLMAADGLRTGMTNTDGVYINGRQTDSGDHLGLNYITTVEDLAVLKRVIVQNVSTTGYAVLNAADPIVADMAATCPGKVIFFAADRHHPLMATHRAQGKRTVYVDGAN